MGDLFETLFNFLFHILEWFVNFFLNVIIGIINMTIQALSDVYQYMIDLLPTGCFIQWHIPPVLLDWIGYVNWFVPLDTVIQCVTTFCCGMIGYFMIRPILKFIQMT